MKDELRQGQGRGKKRKLADAHKPLTADERAEFDMQKAAQYAARAAKRDNREKRIRMFDEEKPENGLI